MKQLALIAITMLLMLPACEQQKPEKIQWQLPLEAPEDPHGSSSVKAALPDWAARQQGEAEVVWLQKNTTKKFSTKLAVGGQTTVKNWDITLLGLASGLRIKNNAFLSDENVDNPAAFVEISRGGKVHYRGWLFERFPELFGMDDPEWKVWLKSITLRPASSEVHNRLP